MNELFDSKKLLQFWPTPKQSARDRVFATTRLIVYSTAILFIMRKDSRFLLIGSIALLTLYVMYKNGMIKESYVKQYQQINDDNVMANVMPTDYIDRPDRPKANIDPKSLKENWDKIHPFTEGRWFAEHNFYTAPSSTIPNNMDEFLQAAYAPMFKPTCREDGMSCDPALMPMGRGPDSIQRRGYQRGTISS